MFAAHGHISGRITRASGTGIGGVIVQIVELGEAKLTDANGDCPAGLTKPVPTPMIHVWIEPHRCGPFAALEGIGGGTIAEGETVLCDHVHGS